MSRLLLSSYFFIFQVYDTLFSFKTKKEHCQEGKSAYGKVVVGRGVKEKMRERGRNEKSESELNGQEEKAQGWEKKEDNDGDRK